jgi:DNA repair exonuclease SbcCD nuclease subunit
VNKFTIVGDPHITPKSLDKGERLFQIVEEIGNHTIWLGDLLDTKEVIRGKCLNMFFDYFKSSKLQHVVLVGNHDWFNLECKDHSLKTLSSLPNVRVIDKIEHHPKLPFVFFPYIHDKAVLKAELSKFTDKNLVAIGHFEVSGFDFGNGHLCEDGVITYEDFSGFKRVISGHFHKLQQNGNFTYLGTPFSHSFGEANQDKVLGVYTLDDDTLALTPTEFPRHISTKIDMSKKGAEKKLQDYLAGNENNLVRIQLHGAPEEVIKLDKSKYAQFKIKWEDKSDASMDSKVNLDETLDNKSQFMEWAKNIKNLDADTVSLGMSILEAVNAK